VLAYAWNNEQRGTWGLPTPGKLKSHLWPLLFWCDLKANPNKKNRCTVDDFKPHRSLRKKENKASYTIQFLSWNNDGLFSPESTCNSIAVQYNFVEKSAVTSGKPGLYWYEILLK
jgi:hypothetical protein